METLVVDASGTITQTVVNAMRPCNEVIETSRNGSVLVELSEPKSIKTM
ncbi:MAG: hypothetical protein KZQ91_04480 [Candidatus Thiodiazotropha sp. (ex Lucinoma borealis)]|nr:hypothetical protein [Candidatus Thiodiazotropha sp. (ex Lucinoma borealis)]